MSRLSSNLLSVAPALLGLSLLLGMSSARAADTNFQVHSSVPPSCVLTVSGSLDFGVYDSIDTNITAPKTAQANIQVKCATGTPGATVYIGKGLSTNYPSCTSPYRELFLNGNPTLAWNGTVYHPDYNIYQDSDMSVYWGCQSGVGNNRGVATGTFDNGQVPKVFPVYGSVDAGKVALPVGTFTDTVSVWVEF